MDIMAFLSSREGSITRYMANFRKRCMRCKRIRANEFFDRMRRFGECV